MMNLIKLDFWLLRWFMPFMIIGPFIFAILFSSTNPINAALFTWIAGITLTQIDEKMKTQRFMLALPLSLKSFLPARALVMVLVGLTWMIFEWISMLIIGGEAPASNNIFFYVSAQLLILLVLAPVTLSIFTLIKQPVVKWVLAFVAYFVITVAGTFITVLGQAFMEDLGSFGYLLAISFIILGAVLFFLVTLIANAVRERMDLV